MKIPELNNIQRVLMICFAISLMLVQIDIGFEDNYLFAMILSGVLVILAFSGDIKVFMTPTRKVIAVSLFIISLIVNVLLLIHSVSLQNELSAKSYRSFEDVAEIISLKEQLIEETKKHNGIK